MILKNSLIYINQFFFFIFSSIRKLYLKSEIYNKKISKINSNYLEYRPSPSLLDSIIKYSNNKKNIKEFSLTNVWSDNKINKKDFKKLHSFFWLFSLDLKSSKKSTQSTIENWIESNQKYNFKNWDTDILSKRIIAWISNSKLTYEDSNEEYKKKFNATIQKQVNHLINEIERSEWIDDKMIGCSAIILTGLAYKNNSRYLSFGINLLKKIIKFSFDDNGFPKSRNIRQLIFYLKYFVLIREWLKESQTDIPEYINETIYYLGQSYALICQDLNQNILFNGNHIAYNGDFENYLRRLGYKFKSETTEVGGYVVLKNKKIALVMDVGEPPEKKFSTDYQSGALSFEIIIDSKKLISNSGYFQNYKHQLNNLSKSTAAQSTMIIDNNSSCNFKKESNQKSIIEQGLKIINKSIIFEKNYWSIKSAHDGYNKKYGVIHERQIEFFTEKNKFIGTDKLIIKKKIKNFNFEIRFHLEPDVKVMKTQDEKSIFIELDKEAWKFVCEDHSVNIETGLYFGKKNSYTENKNIFISGMTQSENQTIKWELIKIT